MTHLPIYIARCDIIIKVDDNVDNIINLIKNEVLKEINNYKNNSDDHYDFWNKHIKYVYDESLDLAKKYNADIKLYL